MFLTYLIDLPRTILFQEKRVCFAIFSTLLSEAIGKKAKSRAHTAVNSLTVIKRKLDDFNPAFNVNSVLEVIFLWRVLILFL